MATTDGQTHRRPVAIVPAPAMASSADLDGNGDSLQSTMPYTCQTCAKRKVKCNKTTPICSSCRKAKLECLYQAPAPRRRKRKLSGDLDERLARYERILHQHGLLPQDADTEPSTEEIPQRPMSPGFNEPEMSITGRLVAGHGKSRYIDSNPWRNLGDDEMQHISDDEAEDPVGDGDAAGFAYSADPVTGAFMGSQQSILQYHPMHAEAIILWKTHVENVEPICKILHIPSTFKMVEMVSQQPAMASKAEECLLFSIYQFAVFSLTEEECAKKFAQSRATLMQRYNFATRQALVNASFLKTTEMSIMQALVLFLIPCRYFYDPHTYWILTGVASRIAQRMGLHRDGEKLGLPPFDVQMRRRLFYQLIPLDGVASQISGAEMTIIPDSWDMQQPLNINDDQIWPGMAETPEERNGATEMIFCLARSCVGKFFIRVRRLIHGAGSLHRKEFDEVESVISEAENEVEEKYIRYCDIVNPLHFLTIGLARSAITSMRIRVRLPKCKNQIITDAVRRELFQLSQKVIDADTAAYAHTSLWKYRWHVRPFFLWGSWDSLIFILTSLWKADLLSPVESNEAWSKIEQMFNNHSELLDPKQALRIAVGHLTLKAWNANPPSSSILEPIFITRLRKVNLKSSMERQDSTAIDPDAKTNITSPVGPSTKGDADALCDSLSGSTDVDTSNDFNFDSADWMFWDQLIQDYQVQSDQQEGVFVL